MNYIVLDLEWNQSPHGKDYGVPELPCEIIEIGAVRLDENLQETGRFHQVIKPKVYKELHFMTKQIVHLSKDELKNGAPFEKAMKDFLEWCGQEYIFCTWGSMDLLELQRNVAFFEVEPIATTPLKFYDIQKFFSLLYEDGKLRRTLQFAIEYFNLKEDLAFHSALNDAIYTARVVQKLDFDGIKDFYSIDCYNIPMDKKSEIYVSFRGYDKYISMGYELREDLMASKDVLSIKCHACGKKCRKKIRWFSNNNKIYYAVGLCKEHGMIQGKLRVKISEHGAYYAIRTTKPIGEDGLLKIQKRQQDLREKRRLRRKMNKIDNEEK